MRALFRRGPSLRTQVRNLTALVDDMIDSWPPTTTATAPRWEITGPVFGQELAITVWSCQDPGIGLSTDQAMQIRREHYLCPADDPAVCRIKAAAMVRLISAGKLVPARGGVISSAPIISR